MRNFMQSLVARFQSLSSNRRQFAFVAGTLFALCLLTLFTAHNTQQPQSARKNSSQVAVESREPIALQNAANAPEADPQGAGLIDAESVSRSAMQFKLSADSRTDPRIAYSADLGVITKDFVHARSSMEEILDRHRGYAARLRMLGHPAGSSLSATLKVPASEYSSTLSDLKSIGDVQQDDEAADEVVQQHGDLEARLQNAKNNERRLQELLKNSDDKSIDIDYVRRQLIALHAEIVRMELERHNVDNRVIFSNIHFSLREVRETPAETLSAQFRRAAGSSLTDLIGTLSTLLIFLISYGPSFLLWAAILFFPARYLWRRSRATAARATA
jgi:hypothetical protein